MREAWAEYQLQPVTHQRMRGPGVVVTLHLGGGDTQRFGVAGTTYKLNDCGRPFLVERDLLTAAFDEATRRAEGLGFRLSHITARSGEDAPAVEVALDAGLAGLPHQLGAAFRRLARGLMPEVSHAS